MLAIGRYIHYRYADYMVEGKQDADSQKYVAQLHSDLLREKTRSAYFGKSGSLIKEFNIKKEGMITGGSFDEYSKMIDFLENPNGAEFNLNDENIGLDFTADRSAAYQNALAVRNTAIRKMVDPNATADMLAEEINKFLSLLNQCLDNIQQTLGNEYSLTQFKNSVIKSYCSKYGFTSSSSHAFSERVLSDFLTHNGIKKLHLNNGLNGDNLGKSASLDTCVKGIVLLAEALPDYGVGGNYSLGAKRYSTGSSKRSTSKTGMKRTKNGSQTLAILIGKMQGLYNNVVGIGGEIAWAKAEQVAMKKLMKEQQSFMESMNLKSKNLEVITKTTGGDVIKQNAEGTQTVSKPDVQITITDGVVRIIYGASVKQYKFDSKAHATNITAVSGTNFYEAFQKYAANNGMEYGYLWNLAAGHPGKGLSSKGVEGNVSSGDLETMWEDLRDNVVLSNFLSFIAGIGVNNENTALYVVANGNAIPMSELLTNLNADNVHTRLYKPGQSIRRGSLMKLNTWKNSAARNKNKRAAFKHDRDAELGVARSNELQGALINELQKIKMDITVKDILRFVK